MKVIGIDPGLAATGYAIIEVEGRNARACTWGCIRTAPRTLIPRRLGIIHEEVSHLLQEWSPGLMVIEDVFVSEKTAWVSTRTGEVKGAIYVAAHHLQVETMDVKPTEVKKALTGNGRAKKAQVEKAVRNTLNLPDKITPDHASDALALALTGIFRLPPSFFKIGKTG